MKKFLAALTVTAAVTFPLAAALAQDAPAPAVSPAGPVIMLATLVGPPGAVVVVLDLVGDKGHYADVKSCEADKLNASNKLAASAAENKMRIVVLDILCFDTRSMNAQSE